MNNNRKSSESTLLLRKSKSTRISSLWLRYKNLKKFPTSKGALAILMWRLATSTLENFILRPATYLLLTYLHKSLMMVLTAYGTAAVILCFCPITGYLADNKYGRYKTIVFSLWVYFIVSILFSVFVALVITAYNNSDSIALFYVATGLLIISVFLLFMGGFETFSTNILPLAMDQLYDFNTDEQSLFLHWFFWISSVPAFLMKLLTIQIKFPYIMFYKKLSNTRTTETSYSEICTYSLFCIALVVLFSFSLYIAYFKKCWFLIEPSRVNPYRLVYKVTQFSWQHKVPLNRSAFTYCEDDIPSGLNLAKNKYGGPFTTEQVEDVKVFYGIMKILFTMGPLFFLHLAADVVIVEFMDHKLVVEIFQKNYSNIIYYNSSNLVKTLLIHDHILTHSMTIICIPLYLLLLRPLFLKYIPGMLKRIGIGAIAKVLSLLCTLVVGVWAHSRYNVGCFFNALSNVMILNDTSDVNSEGPYYDTLLIAIQCVLLSLSYMLIIISVSEFICSQSPHSMKGLIIGLLLCLKGLYYIVGIFLSLPFAFLMDHSHVSCGISYYAMNAGVGVVAVVAYGLVARKYKYRERDEVSNIYMYAENYYSKRPPEE